MKRAIFIALLSVFLFGMASCAGMPVPPETDLYDDFGNARFDGRYDGSRWKSSESRIPTVAQKAGKLSFFTDGPAESGCGRDLYSKALPVPLGGVRYVGAKLSLASPGNTKFSHVGVGLSCPGLERGDFLICAYVLNQETRPVVFCSLEYVGKDNVVVYSYTHDAGFEYGKEITVRIDLDGATGAIRWSVDGVVVAETVSKDLLAAIGKKAKLWLSTVREAGAEALTTVDDAILYYL